MYLFQKGYSKAAQDGSVGGGGAGGDHGDPGVPRVSRQDTALTLVHNIRTIFWYSRTLYRVLIKTKWVLKADIKNVFTCEKSNIHIEGLRIQF